MWRLAGAASRPADLPRSFYCSRHVIHSNKSMISFLARVWRKTATQREAKNQAKV